MYLMQYGVHDHLILISSTTLVTTHTRLHVLVNVNCVPITTYVSYVSLCFWHVVYVNCSFRDGKCLMFVFMKQILLSFQNIEYPVDFTIIVFN